MTCCPWERGHLVHLHTLPSGYLVPNPKVFCGGVKTVGLFVRLRTYQNLQWTNIDIHVRSALSPLTLKTPTTLQSKRIKSPGGHKVCRTPLGNDGKMASNAGSLTAVEKRKLFWGVFRSSTSAVTESRERGLDGKRRGCFSATQFFRLKRQSCLQWDWKNSNYDWS